MEKVIEYSRKLNIRTPNQISKMWKRLSWMEAKSTTWTWKLLTPPPIKKLKVESPLNS